MINGETVIRDEIIRWENFNQQSLWEGMFGKMFRMKGTCCVTPFDTFNRNRLNLLKREAEVITAIDDTRSPVLEKKVIGDLVEVLYHRAARLVNDKETSDLLRQPLLEFVSNVLSWFHENGALNDYVSKNIATALACADNHDRRPGGDVEYSHFIRRLNPTDNESEQFFIIGREGMPDDQGCPMKELQANPEKLSQLSDAQLHTFMAFYAARLKATSRGAPRIPVDEFMYLIPDEIRRDAVLEEVFLDVCFSDGAWELYQLKKKNTSGVQVRETSAVPMQLVA